MDDILIGKFESINRCLKRVEQEYYPNRDVFANNYTVQDAVILNLQRASQLIIDIAINIVENQLNDFIQYMDEIKKNLS